MQDKGVENSGPAIADGPSSPPAPSSAVPAALAGPPTLWLFTLTTFVSALLLFSIQPMFAKMVLPVLGGSPSVWAVALCFFQGALLAGYCYAHLVIRLIGARASGFVHLAVCLLAFVVLPIGLPAGWSEPPTGEPYFWQLGLFTVAVGLPFFAVAANAPLLQAWFAATGHPHGRDPYFLYAASNLGSLIALLSYPVLLEPAFGLKALSGIWTIGFLVLVALLAVSYAAVRLGSAPQAATAAEPSAADAGPPPTWSSRLSWVGLALVPSALLTAFTTHVSTDVASAPLIWVLPLSLYLLTFVLVFRERSLIPMPILLATHLASVIFALLVLSQTVREGWFLTAGAGVAVFFTSAMVAHRTLYEARPSAAYLTEFYLWMSLGGVLGGLFAALIAPKIFSEIFEYPLLLALSMACRPRALSLSLKDRDELLVMWLLIATGILALIWIPWMGTTFGIDYGTYGMTAVLVALFAIGVLLFWKWPPRQLVMALMMFAAIVMYPSGVKRGEAERSYFGVYRVGSAGDFNILMHGTTLHGAQRVRDDKGDEIKERPVPGTYYYPKSPMAQSVRIISETLAKTAPAGSEARGRYGVIGLGAGSLSCLSKPGEQWRFFEIDPLMVSIATNPENFSFLSRCQPNPDVQLGDARLTMAKEPDGSFDLIIVDAFSSDAVPVHLMTAEALSLFLSKIKPTGAFVLHVSNRYLDLDGVAAATLPLVKGAKGVIISDDAADGSYAQTSSTVVVVAKSDEVLAPFRELETVIELDPRGLKPWTDDFSDIIGPFRSKLSLKY
ncbi:MAG: fused MFS/spermidine synthase [Hyphomicrobium sp.]|nr:fused MFS/spermidine synthase [Hyphomicrobium sp.]